jgi:hypothetical protein
MWMAQVVIGRLPEATPLYRPFLSMVIVPHAAGRTAGIDSALARRRPTSWLW